MQVIIIILEVVHIVLGVPAMPIYRVYKGRGLFISALLCWGLWILWAFTWCVILPALVYPRSKEAFVLFPGAIGVPFVIVLGWVPSLTACLIAHGIVR